MQFSKALYICLWGVFSTQTRAATLLESVNVPSNWRIAYPKPDPKDQIFLEIGLKQQNLAQMVDGLYAVSDPDSESYGKYYEHDQVLDLIKPKPEADDLVKSWLRNNSGVRNIHSDGHWVQFSATVAAANDLLNADFNYFVNKNGVKKLRTTQYSVPDELSDAVDLIIPTTYFGKESADSMLQMETRTSAEKPISRNCSKVFTPRCIKKAYNFENYMPLKNSGSRIGFGNFDKQSAVFKDLFKYEKLFNISKQTFSVQTINGGKNNQKASYGNVLEANLDVQTIIGVAAGLPVVGFFTGGLAPFRPNPTEPDSSANTNEPYIAYYKYLLNQPNKNIPQVISHSYSDEEETVPIKYASRACNMMAALGMRGVTLLHSSGDSGVGDSCVSNGKHKKAKYTPHFPRKGSSLFNKFYI